MYGRGECHAVPRRHGQEKTGNDVIFSWLARYQNAAAAGASAVNGTVGALLEDDGNLAINTVVDAALARHLPQNFRPMPLKGLPSFLDLSITLAWATIDRIWRRSAFMLVLQQRPVVQGALPRSLKFYRTGRCCPVEGPFWGPYAGFLRGCGLKAATYPLLPSTAESTTPNLDLRAFSDSLEKLAATQESVMTWLNDPAHNPTGLSLTAESRFALLNAFMESATRHEHVGHTLLLDAAYHLYADEPHGWAETIAEALMRVCLGRKTCWYALPFPFRSRTRFTACVRSLGLSPSRANQCSTTQRCDGVTGRQTWSAAPRVAQHAE